MMSCGSSKTIRLLQPHTAAKANVHDVSGKSECLARKANQLLLSQMVEEKHVFVYKKLVVPSSMRSIYWKCYGFPANENGDILTKVKIVCLICKSVIAYNRNTSNLRMHLQNKHRQELRELEMNARTTPGQISLDAKERRALKRKDISPSTFMYSTASDGTVEVEKHIQIVSDPNISVEEFSTSPNVKVLVNSDDSVSEIKPHENLSYLLDNHSDIGDNDGESPSESKTISDAIAEFIIVDLQLPEIVETTGFQRIVATLRSPCEIPNKLRLIDDILPKIYDTFRETIIDNLNSAVGDISLSFEEWSSASGDVYITVSAHFQQQGLEDELQNKVLVSILCSPLYDAKMWGNLLDNMLDDWHLNLSKVKVVVVSTVQKSLLSALQSRFTLIPCLMSVLQDVCMKKCFLLPNVSELVSKVRTLIGLFHKCKNALIVLRLQEQVIEHEPLAIDNSKFWISSYIMLERFLARRITVTDIVENMDFSPIEINTFSISESDWVGIEDLVNVLEPFKVTLLTLAEEKPPLISLLKPLMWQLLSVHLKIRENDSSLAKTLKEGLAEMLKEKYFHKKVENILSTATALDPRFKQLPYSNDDEKALVNRQIKEKLSKIVEESGSSVDETKNLPSKKGRLSGMELLLGDVCLSSNAISIRERTELEISLYQSEPAANLDQCPLEWWQIFGIKFPNLSKLALSYNCVPATVIPPSRIPLESQLIFNMKRSNLGPEIVDKLLFLNANHNLS